jgi:hypothetical protein
LPDPQSTAVGAPVILTDEIRQIEEAEFVLDFVGRSRDYMQPFLPIWSEVDDNYMVTPFGTTVIDSLGALLGLRTAGVARRTTETMSRLKDPESHQIVETLAWQGIGMAIGAPNYLQATPIGMDDPEKARLISRLLMATLDGSGVYRTMYQLFKGAFTRGTAILETGWESRERTQMVKKPIFNPISGAIDAYGLSPESVIFRDRVLLREIPIRNFYFDPSGMRLGEDMNGAAKKFRTNWWKAAEYANSGVYDRTPTMEAIRTAQGANTPKETQILEQEFPRLEAVDAPVAYGSVNGFEFCGEVPFNRPGGRNRVITLLNGRWVRGRPNPYLDGELPWDAMVVNPISGRIYGLSPLEVIRFLQDAADNFMMIFSDAGDLAIRGPMLLGQAFGGDPEKVRLRRLNDVIMCRNVDAVKQMPFDMSPLQWAAQEMARRKQTMREAGGAMDQSQAIQTQGGGDQTATQNTNLMRMAGGRIRGMVELAERDFFPNVARKIHSRIRQFAEPDILARLQGDVFHVNLADIDVEADVRFTGSQQGENSFTTNATYSQIVATLGSIPLSTVRAFPDVFIKWFRDGLKAPDAESIVQRAIELADEQDAQAQQAAQMEATAGGSAPSQSRGGSPPAQVKLPTGTPAGEAEQSGGMIA